MEAELGAGLLADAAVVAGVDLAGQAGVDAHPGAQLAAQVDLLAVDDKLTDAA